MINCMSSILREREREREREWSENEMDSKRER